MIGSHELEEVVAAGWAPSVRWLQARLRRGDIKGRKVGRTWKMSDRDVEALVEWLGNETVERVHVPRIGLSEASARRRRSA